MNRTKITLKCLDDAQKQIVSARNMLIRVNLLYYDERHPKLVEAMASIQAAEEKIREAYDQIKPLACVKQAK